MRRQPPRTAARVIAAAAVVGCAVLAAAAARPADLFDEIYARGRTVESSLKTITAAFTETSTSPLLTTPLVAHGRLTVQRPGQIVLRYTDPDRHVLLIDGNTMTLAWPSKQIVQRSDIGTARRRIDKYFIDKSPDELRRSFTIAARVAPDRPRDWAIDMTPKRDQIKEGLSRLTLWIDRDRVLLSAMRMHFPNGSAKELTFEDVVVNGPVEASAFSISP